MPVESFSFAPAVVAAASDRQRTFLDDLTGIVRARRPPLLDLDAVGAVVDARGLFVDLPHRHDPGQHIAVTVANGQAVVASASSASRLTSMRQAPASTPSSHTATSKR